MTDDARARVAKAGREILIADGLIGLSPEAACRRAGVETSPFATQSDLVVAALDEHWAVLKPVFEGMFDRARPPLERVRCYIDGAYAFQEQFVAESGGIIGCVLLRAGSSAGRQDDAVRRKVAELFDVMGAYLEQAIRDAQAERLVRTGDPAVMARTLLEYLEGVLAVARIGNDLRSLRGAMDRVLEFLGARVVDFRGQED